MISARRLAREWALKILYQSDVGKMPIAESQAAALERLRMEFVHRAARSACGSLLEEHLADVMTAQLKDLLPHFDSCAEPLLHECFARIADAAEYWSHQEIDVSVSRQSFNALWEIPNRQITMGLPISTEDLPSSRSHEPMLASALRSLSQNPLEGPSLTRAADAFLKWAREALPSIAMAAYAGEIRLGRPSGAKLKETHEHVVGHWRNFGKSMAERWRPAVIAVEKQTSDWLRVAAFTQRLVEGVSANQEAIDRTLESREIGWSLDRQVSVDRSILRMAAFELFYLESIPASATINEAVELAKKYSTAESGKFVNGILGAIVTGKKDLDGSVERDEHVIDLRAEEVDALVDAEEPAEEELAHA